MQPAWGGSWAWGLSLIALTIMLHALAVVIMAMALERIGRRIMRNAHLQPILSVAAVFGAIGLVLATLHGLEACLWAATYIGIGAIDSYREAILYSLDSMTTRGAAGMQLEARWELMGALEAADGMLLFGVSTAFLFAVLQQVLPLISNRAEPSAHNP